MNEQAAVERLQALRKVLQKERDEDFRLYNDLFLRVNLEQRRKFLVRI